MEKNRESLGLLAGLMADYEDVNATISESRM